MEINVQIDGLADIKKKLKDKITKLEDLTQYWDTVGQYLQRKTINERFGKEQSPDGTKWKPLSEARIKQRMKRHRRGNMKILQDTGELRRSIKYDVGKNYVKIGSNLKYARTHQFGSKKKNIPARPYLGITEKEKRYIASMMAAYIKRHILGENS